MKFFLKIFVIAVLFCSCDSFKSADEYFAEAEELRTERKPKEALRLLKKITSKYSNDVKAPDAQYLIAEIYYRDLQDFSKSITEYDKFVFRYPDSKKVPFSVFMQGYIFANELMKHDSAKILYEKFISLYPDHEMVKSVRFELKYLGLDIDEIPQLKHLTE